MKAALLVVLCACADEAPTLRPIIDVPPEDPDDPGEDPYGQIDQIELAVAKIGASDNLADEDFGRGETLSLPSVPFEDDLVVHMTGRRAAGGEQAYGRTCALDLADGVDGEQPHLYFANVLTFAPATPPADDPQRGGGVIGYSLSDGSAVFLYGDGVRIDRAVRYRPHDDTFEPLGLSLAPRTDARVARFFLAGDDRALVIGGLNGEDDAWTTVHILDPTAAPAQHVTELADWPGLKEHGAVTLSGAGGGVLVAGGRTQDEPLGGFRMNDLAWVFTIGAGGMLQSEEVTPLSTPRAGATMTRLDDESGEVLVAGGENAGLPVAASELYRPASRDFVPGPDMVRPRWGHAAARIGRNAVLVWGGRDASGPVSEIEIYLPFEYHFFSAGTIPAEAGVTEISATTLRDGRVLVAGGNAAGAPSAGGYLVTLRDNQTLDIVPLQDPMAAPRAGHAAALLCDGTVMLVGGIDLASGDPPSERFNPESAQRR